MKIAFLHMTMGIVERGSEVVVEELATELSKKNEVLIIQSGKAKQRPYKIKRVMPLDTAPIPAPTNILDKVLFRLHLDDESGRVVDFTKAALPELQKFNPDIVIAVNGSLQLRVLRGLVGKAKIVVFGHAGIGYHDRHTLKSKPGLFIALTPQAEDWARQFAPKNTKVICIPNPIDFKRFKHVKRAKTNLTKPIVMTVSALSAYKNVLQIVKAIRQTSASYLLIGEGEESESIAQEFSTLVNSFLWIKHQDRSQMASYYLSSDVFCFTPDNQEAFGMVYLEAMAAGLPIVASDDPIRRKMIGKKGIFVDPHNIAEIVKGIGKAIQLDKIDYSKELESFDLKHVVKQIDKEFHDLIK
jgi:glycosyltransferase involved in cell wall biosynthesis